MQKELVKRLLAAAVLLLIIPIAVVVVLKGVRAAAPVAAPVTTEIATTAPETTTAPALITLSVTSPEKTNVTVKEPFVKVQGVCDPSLPLTVNGQSVTCTQDGFFAYDCPLSVGENTVTVTDTVTTLRYTVVYELELLRSVSPSKSVKLEGGTTLELSAVALEDTTVKATLNGKTVRLSPDKTTADDSGFLTYRGNYTVPAAQYKAQNLGKIRFSATLDGYTRTKTGASVTVNAIVYADIPIEVGEGIVKPPEVTGEGYVQVLMPSTDYGRGKARILQVTATEAETVPASTADDKSSPLYTPFLKGTYDYIVGTGTYDGDSYYITKSGCKVETCNAKAFDGFVLPTNTISAYKGYTDGETNLILTMNWKVPFLSELREQRYYNGYSGRVFNVTSSTASYIDFKFFYTNAAEGSFDLSGSNVLQNAEWVNVGKDGTATLRIYLREKGKFYGYRAYYSSDNRLVLAFRNRPTSVNSAVVALDPGHGGNDPGAIGVNGVYESTVNLRIAALVKQKLEAQGVRVVILRTGNTTISLDDRRKLARQSGADLFVAIHNNSSTSGKTSGTEVYYYRAFSQPLASSVHASLVSAWREIYKGNAAMTDKIVPQDGGVRYYPFRVTRIEECPAVLVECGYLSNTTECNAVCQPANQEKLAGAIANGILRYLENNTA